MAVSKFTSASGGNDFNVNVGSTYSVVNFTQEYAAGAYSFTSAQLDITLDVYAYDGLGNLAGYTNGKGLITTTGFNKLVIIGGTVGDVLSFSYKTTYNSVAETAEPTAGPVILSATPPALPNINSSTTITGLNFSTDVAATFKGSDNLVRNAKSVVRGSVNSLVVTRPDSFPTANSPYTLTVTNSSVAYQPTGSNSNTILVTAGVNPVWVTTALPPSIYGSTYSSTLSATDADGGSSFTYAITAGSLPTGLSFNTATGAITGTPNGTGASDFLISVLATDSGGNTASRNFTLSHWGNTLGGSDATYYYRVFTSNGTFLTPNTASTVDIFAIAGGGGGGSSFGGGGGAGGAIYAPAFATTAASYPIVVGGGAARSAAADAVQGSTGSPTTGFGFTCNGGGGGGAYNNSYNGTSGGSGGGGGSSETAGTMSGGAATQTSGTGFTGYGFRGGNSFGRNPYVGTGGGGAGAQGQDISSGSTAGNGGSGLNTFASWLSAVTPVMTGVSGWSTATSGGYIAGGGGGAGYQNPPTTYPGTGGAGGGANGVTGYSTPGINAIANTGSGGGGGGYPTGGGGAGGTGIVIVRYTRASVGG